MNIEQVRELLPETVRRIADIAGLPAAMKLVDEIGGTSWFFAKGFGPSGQARVAALADIVGEEAAQRLTQLMPERDDVYIPRCDVALRRLRDLEMHRQFEQAVRDGVSANTVVAELARTYRLSDRRVWIILKQPLSSSQSGLFD